MVPGSEPVRLMVAADLRVNDEGVQLWDGIITDITRQKMADRTEMSSSSPTVADPYVIDWDPGLIGYEAPAVCVA
ncbi:hypothetical protein LX81_03772 [Palleronia aestuarii]|uniref:Uncharacterized protein n=1 Tax=Palleronia aestuarii TaxID=568105 RepID=A0A2W7NFL6_9RHOB|nr:hypothetical protein [Palleronia aestuarii]PZX11896.1 hypothetical protein LX81_03772 [Palleronia aestuarii]